MKKKLIFAGAVVLMAAAAVTAYMANYRPDPFDLLNANIEALAQDESLDPGEGRDFIYCITTVQRNYPIGSVDLNRNHSSDVLV